MKRSSCRHQPSQLGKGDGTLIEMIAMTLACDEHLRRAKSLLLTVTLCAALLMPGVAAFMTAVASHQGLLFTGTLAGGCGLLAQYRARTSRHIRRPGGFRRRRQSDLPNS